MHLSTISALATAFFAASSQALNLLVTNDDGFGAANMREFYRLLKAAGHNAFVVASATDMSGQGGRAVFTANNTLLTPAEFNLLPAGAPSFGQDPSDSHIWYYNGTPAACVFVALDYVIPKFLNNITIDAVVAGPNVGDNLGPFLYTLSGTIGATYAAVGRGIPAIAFSGGDSVQRSYKQLNQTNRSGLPDPATIEAQLVNYPFITSATNTSCVNPPFIQTRLTGHADTDGAVFNTTSGLFTFKNVEPLAGVGINACINGSCALPGETAVVDGGCAASVSVFTVDYDAPGGTTQTQVRQSLTPLVQFVNGTSAKKVRREFEA